MRRCEDEKRERESEDVPRAVPTRRHEITTLSHEMMFDRQKLTQNCEFAASAATLSYEMMFDRQKLTQNCDFAASAATTSHEMMFDRQKLT